MRRNYIRICAALLLLLFTGYSTPKELWHLFSHHADTHHEHKSDYDLQFSAEHHHCELLKADQYLPALADCGTVFIFKTPPLYAETAMASYEAPSLKHLDPGGYALRGPPGIV